VVYPPRDACPSCLSARLPYRDVNPNGRLVVETVVRIATDPYFRARVPWRIGIVKLDAGPILVVHLHGDVSEGGRVRLALKLDKSGGAVAIALPPTETPNMQDDPQLREMICNPKFRRVLITDGRTAVGQAIARSMSDAGAEVVFVGLADPAEGAPGLDLLRAIERVEVVPLDVTDAKSVTEQAEQNGGRIDILINTAARIRPGGIVARSDIATAGEEMDVRYFGLMRLAQAFGPALQLRGDQEINSAPAFVNLLSVYALMNWPTYGAYSAAEAACLSATQCLRAELRPGGVKVINIFFGPLDIESFQTVPPPKVSPTTLAQAVVEALTTGLEDVFVGDVAQDVRARLAINPKAVERELGD
jgi:NAD(P)-dependent dehydrogenase (short-subunit alcohol dehydrogenase family)